MPTRDRQDVTNRTKEGTLPSNCCARQLETHSGHSGHRPGAGASVPRPSPPPSAGPGASSAAGRTTMTMDPVTVLPGAPRTCRHLPRRADPPWELSTSGPNRSTLKTSHPEKEAVPMPLSPIPTGVAPHSWQRVTRDRSPCHHGRGGEGAEHLPVTQGQRDHDGRPSQGTGSQ